METLWRRLLSNKWLCKDEFNFPEDVPSPVSFPGGRILWNPAKVFSDSLARTPPSGIQTNTSGYSNKQKLKKSFPHRVYPRSSLSSSVTFFRVPITDLINVEPSCTLDHHQIPQGNNPQKLSPFTRRSQPILSRLLFLFFQRFVLSLPHIFKSDKTAEILFFGFLFYFLVLLPLCPHPSPILFHAFTIRAPVTLTNGEEIRMRLGKVKIILRRICRRGLPLPARAPTRVRLCHNRSRAVGETDSQTAMHSEIPSTAKIFLIIIMHSFAWPHSIYIIIQHTDAVKWLIWNQGHTIARNKKSAQGTSSLLLLSRAPIFVRCFKDTILIADCWLTATTLWKCSCADLPVSRYVCLAYYSIPELVS